jgi:hypothetical protein
MREDNELIPSPIGWEKVAADRMRVCFVVRPHLNPLPQGEDLRSALRVANLVADSSRRLVALKLCETGSMAKSEVSRRRMERWLG